MKKIIVSVCFLSTLAFANLQTEYQSVLNRVQSASTPIKSEELMGIHQARCLTRTARGYEVINALFLIGRFDVMNSGKTIAGVNFLIQSNSFYFFGQKGEATLERLVSAEVWDYVQKFFNGQHNNKNYTASASVGFQKNSYVSSLGYESQTLRHYLTNVVTVKNDSQGFLFIGQESNYYDGDVPDLLLFYCGQSKKLATPKMIPDSYR